MKEYIDLCKYRLDQARESLQDAQYGLTNNRLKLTVNRSYYAIFHAIRALLALSGVDFKRHSAVIAYFRKHYIKTGKFDKIYSDIITHAFDIRNSSDYEDFYIISRMEAESQVSGAEQFMNAITDYLKKEGIDI